MTYWVFKTEFLLHTKKNLIYKKHYKSDSEVQSLVLWTLVINSLQGLTGLTLKRICRLQCHLPLKGIPLLQIYRQSIFLHTFRNNQGQSYNFLKIKSGFLLT